MDEYDDLHLSIPLDPMKDFFSCPVCMCLYQMTVMTPCGHRYCEGCIIEWIDRKRKCPCCNAPVKISDLIRDTAFDGLINVVVKQKNKVEGAYFTSLIEKCNHPLNAAGDVNDGCISEEGKLVEEGSAKPQQVHKSSKSKDLSPVEQVLQKHIQAGIVEHEKYYRTIKGQFESQSENADREIELLEGAEDDKSQAERKSWIQRKHTLQVEFTKCTTLLTSAYDKYLRDHLPPLSTVPVTVFVHLFGKSLQMGDMVLKPQFTISDIKEALFQRVKEKHDKVAIYREDSVHYLLVRPYAKGHVVVDEALLALLLSRPDPYNCDPSDLVSLLHKDSIPVLEYVIQPGSFIVVFGDFKLRSELPRPCFSILFDEGEEDKMDYYRCKDCSFNWVCRSCKEHCHKDHETVPYVMGHQPTWACCYCPRNKKCLLQEPGY